MSRCQETSERSLQWMSLQARSWRTREKGENQKPGATDSTLPPPKRSRHHLSGFDPVWTQKFSWVQLNETAGSKDIMCKLCRKHSQHPKTSVVGRAIWVDLLWVTFTRHTLTRHEHSDSHLAAKTLEANLCMSHGRKTEEYKKPLLQ